MKAVVLNKRSKQIIVSLLVLLLTYFGFIQPSDKSSSQHNTATSTATTTIAEAYQRQATNFKVTDSGKVVKFLRVMVRPMHYAPVRIPFIHAVKFNTVTYL